MRNLFNILVLFLIWNANNALGEKLSSFEGLHFYVGFMQNEVTRVNPQIPVDQKVFISSQRDANLTINLPYEGTQLKFVLKKGEIFTLDINSIYEISSSEVTQTNKLIYINSDVPITVYAFSTQEKTSDSYSVIPVSYWGNEYTVVSVPNDTYSDPTETMYNTPRQSEFLVMAQEDNTEILITPTYNTERGKPAGTEFKIILNKGNSYLVQSENVPLGQGDLTGTAIRSNKPIGVLSGHVRASIPVGIEKNLDSKDHLIEMLMPYKAWGKEFISIPFGVNSMGDYFKVVSTEADTKVIVRNSGGEITRYTNSANKSITLEKINEPTLWISETPIQLAQFMMRTEIIDDVSFADYDPSMVMVVPTEQFISYVNFHTPGNTSTYNPNQYKRHYALIVAESEALPTLELDGQKLTAISEIQKNNILNTNYHWAKVQLSKGVHTLSSQFGRFSGTLFGVGRYDSYAFVLGSALTKPGTNDLTPPCINFDVNCFDLSGKIQEIINDDNYGMSHIELIQDSTYNYQYIFDEITPFAESINFSASVINPYEDAKFTFIAFDKNGNEQKYSYLHNAINLSVPAEIDFGTVYWQDSLCIDLNIINQGKTAQEILSVDISGDSRAKVYFDQAAIELNPTQETQAKICVSPAGVDGILNATVKIDLGCGIIYSVAVKANIIGTGLSVEGYDFGNVRVGESKCGKIKISNKGKVPIIITSIDTLELGTDFTIDQSSLPDTLEVNEMIELDACFYPESRGLVEKNFYVQNEFNINKFAKLKGYGLAPELNSVSYDFGAKRIGTSNSQTVYIINSGDADIRISFDRFALKTISDDAITTTLSAIKNELIRAGDSIGIPLVFVPQNNDLYQVTAVFTTDWQQINNIFIDVQGRGTIPQIEITNVTFDDTFIYSSRDITQEIISSGGNEDLSIIDAFILSGDEESFEFDLTTLKNNTLPTGEAIELQIKFSPIRLGYHELIVGILNDANPNYEQTIDTLVISGNAILDPNQGLAISHENENMIKCDWKNFKLILTNTSDLPIDLSSIQLADISLPDIIEEISDINSSLPLTLQPGEKFEANYEILPQNDEVQLLIKITLFESIEIDYPVNLSVESLQNEITVPDDMSVEIGSIINLEFNGEFPESTNGIMIKPNFRFNVGMRNFWLKSEIFEMEITDESGQKSVLGMDLIHQEMEYLEFEGKNEILINSRSKWKINLDFLSLLSRDREVNLSAIISSNNCFLTDSSTFFIKYNEICNFDLLNVKLIANLPNVNVAPNPIYDKINFTFELGDESDVKVVLTDLLGSEINIIDNMRLSSGKHEISLEVTNISSGMYQAHISIGNKNFNKLILISK